MARIGDCGSLEPGSIPGAGLFRPENPIARLIKGFGLRDKGCACPAYPLPDSDGSAGYD